MAFSCVVMLSGCASSVSNVTLLNRATAQPPIPIPPASSALSPGQVLGFSSPRPIAPNHWTFSTPVSDWRHMVARGDQTAATEPERKARYDVLAGPFSSGPTTMTIDGWQGADAHPRLGFSNGVMYARGRYIIPGTRRLRGTSGGGQHNILGGSGSNAPCDSEDIVPIQGTIVVYSGLDKDIVFYPSGHDEHPTNFPKIVLRGWLGQSGCVSPDYGTGCEVGTCLTIRPGYYYVVTTNEATRTQTAVEIPWTIPAGSSLTHDPQARDVITLVNSKITTANMPSILKSLDTLSP
jgi:hypothetical protein